MEARQFEEVVACAPSDEEIAEQKTNAMVEDVKTISKQAAVLNIQSEADYNDAAEIGKGIRARIKTVQALFKPIKEAANLAHKRACEQEKALLDPLKKAEQAVTCEMSRYTERLEIKRGLPQRKQPRLRHRKRVMSCFNRRQSLSRSEKVTSQLQLCRKRRFSTSRLTLFPFLFRHLL